MSDSIIPTRICTKCETIYPATDEFFHKSKGGKYGLRADCKKCSRNAQRDYSALHPEEERMRSQLFRKNNPKYHLNWRMKNKERVLECERERYAANPEKFREKRKRYYQKNIEKEQSYRKKYYRENLRQILNNRQKYNLENYEKARKYREENRKRYLAHAHNRRARLQNAPGSYTATELKEQFKRQKGRCYYCGNKLPKQGWHADHIVPLSRGGANDIGNIVCSCPSCNLSKGDKLPHEWDGTDKLL